MAVVYILNLMAIAPDPKDEEEKVFVCWKEGGGGRLEESGGGGGMTSVEGCISLSTTCRFVSLASTCRFFKKTTFGRNIKVVLLQLLAIEQNDTTKLLLLSLTPPLSQPHLTFPPTDDTKCQKNTNLQQKSHPSVIKFVFFFLQGQTLGQK